MLKITKNLRQRFYNPLPVSFFWFLLSRFWLLSLTVPRVTWHKLIFVTKKFWCSCCWLQLRTWFWCQHWLRLIEKCRFRSQFQKETYSSTPDCSEHGKNFWACSWPRLWLPCFAKPEPKCGSENCRLLSLKIVDVILLTGSGGDHKHEPFWLVQTRWRLRVRFNTLGNSQEV